MVLNKKANETPIESKRLEKSAQREVSLSESVNLTSYAIVLVFVAWVAGFYWGKSYPEKVSFQRFFKTSSLPSKMPLRFAQLKSQEEKYLAEPMTQITEAQETQIPQVLPTKDNHRILAAIPSKPEQTSLKEAVLSLSRSCRYLENLNLSQVGDELHIQFEVGHLFHPGKAHINKNAVDELEKLVEVIMGKSQYKYLEVQGHTDSIPVKKNKKKFPTNWELSGARAASVLRMFVDKGYSKERIRYVGYGASRPLVAEKDLHQRFIAKNMQKNRRIVLVLKNKDSSH